MKDYIHFFIVYTLLELLFTALYLSAVKKPDATVVVGTLLYALLMLAGYLSYREKRYKKRRQELLDALP